MEGSFFDKNANLWYSYPNYISERSVQLDERSIVQGMSGIMKIDDIRLQSRIQAKTDSVHTNQLKAVQAAVDLPNYDRIQIRSKQEHLQEKKQADKLGLYAPSSDLKAAGPREILFDASLKRAGDYAMIHSPVDKWLDQDQGYLLAQMQKNRENLLATEHVFRMSVSNGIQIIQ